MPKTPNSSRQTVRMPLVGVNNTRVNSNTSTAGGVVGVGVVGTMIVGAVSVSDKDQRFVNVIFDKITNPLTGNVSFYVIKRPGFAAHNTPAAGSAGSAIKVWNSQGTGGKIISAFGATNSTIYDGTTSKGAITGVANFLDEADVSGTATILIVSSDDTAWYYQDGGAPTEITDADFPTGITGRMVSIDGYNFIMTTAGKVWNSDINSITAWSAGNNIAAQMYPDKGVGLARYKNSLVAFGKETTEFFRINENTTGVGSPLMRIDQAFLKVGCASQFGYTQVEDTVAWVASTDRGGCAINILDNYSAKKISTAAIDNQLALSGPANIRLNCIKVLGKTLIFATVLAQTFVYSIEDNVWCQWNSITPLWTDMSTAAASTTWAVYTVSNQTTSGKVYTISPSNFVYQDDGSSYTMSIQTSKLDAGMHNIKFYYKLTLIGDEATTSTPIYIQWSDDDYQTFSAARTVDMMDSRAMITRLGKARQRAFNLSNSSNGPVRLEAMELVIQTGVT